MLGVLAILSVLAGLGLGLIGHAVAPVAAGVLVAGALLAGRAAVEARRCEELRRVIGKPVLYTLTAGLVLIEIPLFLGALWLALSVPPGRNRMLLGGAAVLSLVLVVVLPVYLLARRRGRRFRVRYRVSREPPGPLVWDFRQPLRVAAAAGAGLALVLALVPLYTGWPPLELALRIRSPGFAALCLNLGADPNRPGPGGQSPLALAVGLDEPALVALLLRRGADPNDRRPGDPPLVAAVAVGGAALMRPLLEHGADPNLPGRRGLALGIAARRGDLEAVDLLLERGADIEQRDHTGCTAVVAALRFPLVLARLLAAGADPNAYCTEHNPELPGDRVTPLMIAAARGLEPAVGRLLAAGARPALKSAGGRTALDLAVEHRQDAVALVLGGGEARAGSAERQAFGSP